MDKLEALDQRVSAEVFHIKIFLVLGVLVFILALALQVVLAVVPFYFYWDFKGVEDPMFGALSFGIITWLAILAYALRSILFDFSKPEGIDVSEHAELFKLVKTIAQEANAPMPEKILLTAEFNAYVSTYKTYTHPVSQHYLALGVQFLAAVSEDELKSVIAHELGHLSKDHTYFSRFIYRIYHGLYSLDCVLGNSHGFIDKWFHKGLSLYLKKLDQLSYATLRNHEFQADAIAAKITSNPITASLLCRTAIISEWVEDTYWKQIWRNTWKSAVPEQGLITRVCALMSEYDREAARKYFDISKMKQTKEGDTHPCLKDRVEFLGENIRVPEPVKQEDLAIHVLGLSKDRLIKACDDFWQEEVQDQWHDYHFYMRDCVMKRDLLEKMKTEKSLLFGEKMELAQLIGVTLGMKAKLKELLRLNKTHPSSGYILMQMIKTLYQLRHTQLTQVADVLIKRGSFSQQYYALDMLTKHHKRLGNKDEVELLSKKNDQYEIIDKKRNVYKKEDFIMHDLIEPEVEQIKLWLKSVGDIDLAMICKVDNKQTPDSPLHLLFILTDCYVNMDLSEVIWSGLNIKFDTLIVDAEYHEKSAKYLLEKIPAARLFGEF